ncbi:mitotic-spindle organizing protein 1 isoform X1 [Vidua macroura]|uniref:mitotic-spindle organizing protein 1 isoform X1 n=1 Tax=Vidua macroura TaxID=187451 RepID=UPI0023A84338|nr:mitotic-spindle organizing protein 1 isoform X1 [Vidua macroura]
MGRAHGRRSWEKGRGLRLPKDAACSSFRFTSCHFVKQLNPRRASAFGPDVAFPFYVLFEISRILNTGLDMETLSICVRLCEQGINPEALSSVIKELRKATEALKAAENMTG